MTSTTRSSPAGGLVETHKNYDPRVIFFYFVVAVALLVLAGGLAYQQIFKNPDYNQRERYQNQRQVLIPSSRGEIRDREGRILVANRSRFSVMLHLDELREEISREYSKVKKAYRATGKDIPTDTQLQTIARVTVTQRYLDDVAHALGREIKADVEALKTHFKKQLFRPFPLLEDLSQEDCARLIEGLPVNSPVQVYPSPVRDYPYGSAAAHTLGYVGVNDTLEAEDFPGDDLRLLYRSEGTIGRDGLEKTFDRDLQGEPGARIVRVDPSGYRVDSKDLPHRSPEQGKTITTSLDIDLQRAAEEALGDQLGSAVALDVRTGEVLVLASKPDYNLADLSPRFTKAARDDIEARGAWTNQAIGGTWPPGSTFKILTTIAALRRGAINPTDPITICDGEVPIAGRPFYCDNGRGHHGAVLLRDAIAHSCDIFYYKAGELTTPEGIAEEARRFHLDRRTGIELPNEVGRMLIPDPAWKKTKRSEAWFKGDTANISIGQGDILVSPLQMAAFVASVARNEVFTQPTIIHDPNRPVQHTESIGLTTAQRAALIEGMEGTTTYGTASKIFNSPAYRVPGVRVAGKTGTAQKDVTKAGVKGKINIAWFICFAPVENPEVALAVMIEGDTLGETFGGGTNAGPVASTILKKYFEKKNRPTSTVLRNPLAP
jgi:penicillin-binding protein 2